MFSAVELTGSSLPLNAIAVALVALSVAGCSADVTRFNNSSFSRAAQSDRSGVASLRSAWSRRAVDTSPKADLGTGGRLAEVVSSGSSTIRVAPGNRPIGLSRRDRQQNAFANGTATRFRRRSISSAETHRDYSGAARPGAESGRDVGGGHAGCRTMFQWPVGGKILSHFGPQPNGEKNNGLTIAVPKIS